MKKYSIYKNDLNDTYFIIKALKDIYDVSGNKIVSKRGIWWMRKV